MERTVRLNQTVEEKQKICVESLKKWSLEKTAKVYVQSFVGHIRTENGTDFAEGGNSMRRAQKRLERLRITSK